MTKKVKKKVIKENVINLYLLKKYVQPRLHRPKKYNNISTFIETIEVKSFLINYKKIESRQIWRYFFKNDKVLLYFFKK